MSQTPINPEFLLEFYRCSLNSSNILEVGMAHLKPRYLPNANHKKLWGSITDHYSVQENLPTMGILGQMYSDKPEILSLLSDMKAVSVPDKNDLLEQLEAYIKNAKFQVAYDDLFNLFDSDKKEEAYVALNKFAEDVNNFSIRSQYFDRVFAGFDQRMIVREYMSQNPTGEQSNFRIPFGITELDAITRGGISAGDIACFLAQSGQGKSKYLKWIGVTAARLGYKVAHFQAEGTKQECLDLYDATWSSISLSVLEQGLLTEDQRKEVDKAVSNIGHFGGEIFVEAFETFGSASMLDVRNSLVELEKINGKMDLVLIDYLEKVDPGDGKKYSIDQEKQRREAVSQKMKNIAVEFNTRVVTATQAHGIEKKMLDDPEFVMDRYNTSMGKNLLDPFSFFITMNQTDDEKSRNIMRLYCDKIRNYKSKQIINIYQNYNNEKFYDKQKTVGTFYKHKN